MIRTVRFGGSSLDGVLRARIRTHAWWCFALAATLLATHWGGAPSEGLNLAYLDPGAGSFVVQAVVATIAGIAVAMRAYWSRIKAFLGKDSSKDGGASASTTTHGDDE
jgi:hypothetical protein